jgi:general secretion pathway protein J
MSTSTLNQNLKRIPARSQGFTLLEVLIAVGITALLSLGVWQLLHGTINAQHTIQGSTDKLSDLQRTIMFLSRDIEQIVPRSIRDNYGDRQDALSTADHFYALKLTRTGLNNLFVQHPRSDLQRVGYSLDDDKLVRSYWTVLDRAQNSEPVRQDLMKGVISIKFTFMQENGQWTDIWPTDDMINSAKGLARYNTLPKALKMVIDTKDFGKIERLYDLPKFVENPVQTTSNQGSDSNNTNPNTAANN